MSSHARRRALPALTARRPLPQPVSGTDLLEARMPSMNSCRVIFPSWSLSMRRKKSITRDFLWFIQRMYFFRQTSKSKFANSFSWKEIDSQHRNPKGATGAPTSPHPLRISPGGLHGPSQHSRTHSAGTATRHHGHGTEHPHGQRQLRAHRRTHTAGTRSCPLPPPPSPPPPPLGSTALRSLPVGTQPSALQHNRPLALLLTPPGTPVCGCRSSQRGDTVILSAFFFYFLKNIPRVKSNKEKIKHRYAETELTYRESNEKQNHSLLGIAALLSVNKNKSYIRWLEKRYTVALIS